MELAMAHKKVLRDVQNTDFLQAITLIHTFRPDKDRSGRGDGAIVNVQEARKKRDDFVAGAIFLGGVVLAAIIDIFGGLTEIRVQAQIIWRRDKTTRAALTSLDLCSEDGLIRAYCSGIGTR